MRHVVIGTAGHVDHGKTSLVYALTDVQTDRLPEEQKRGITIELGFAPWRVNDDILVSIIDAPGHRRLVHTMIAGASGIDLVLLVVAADEGVMPQTREHVAACRLLGVNRAVIAITKIDRADRELGELAGEEALELLEHNGIDADVVLCSGKTGEGIEELRAAVLTAIDRGKKRGPARRMRLGIDRVFSVHGSGTVITGTLVEGSLQIGSELRILRNKGELASGVRGLHIHGDSRKKVKAPTRLAINLTNVSTDELRRGDVITTDKHVMPTRVLDVWLDLSDPVKRGTEASIFIGTARTTAKVQPLQDGQFDGGQLARLRLRTPLVAFGGDRFVLRGANVDGPAGAVIGGGIVLDARPPHRGRAAKRRQLLIALKTDDPFEAAAELAREKSPTALTRHELHSRLAVESSRLVHSAEQLVERGKLIATQEGGWVGGDATTLLEQQALALVIEHHQSHPFEPGLKLQTLRDKLRRAADAETAAVVLERLSNSLPPRLTLADSCMRLPDFSGPPEGSPEAHLIAQAREAMAASGLSGFSANAFADALGSDAKISRALLAMLVRETKAIETGGLWFGHSAVEQLTREVHAHLDAHETLSVQSFKQITGLGRKQSIPLLEYLDRNRVTRRQGDDRIKA